MKILFLGYSNLLRSRILPVLHRTPFVEVYVAKYIYQEWDDKIDAHLSINKFDSYEDGLEKFDGDTVYISIVNSSHYYYAKLSLELGYHTIIDKPATMTFAEAQQLCDIARDKHLLLSEATVYLYHPQIKQISQLFREYNDEPKLITTHFSMPPFESKNFRYNIKLGGGAIMDTSPYAVSIARYFLHSELMNVSVAVNEVNCDGLEVEYSLLMQYYGGKCLIGHFGFNTEYTNSIMLMGNRLNVSLDRIYTIPDDMENQIYIQSMNKKTTIHTACGNTFVNYLCDIADCILRGDFRQYRDMLIRDAMDRQMILDNYKNF